MTPEEQHAAALQRQIVEQQLAQQSGLVSQPTAPASALIAPGAYQAPYDDSNMRDPKKMLWAGVLSDIGRAMINNRGGQLGQMGNTGFQMYNQAQAYNDRLNAANIAAQRQHRMDQNAYANALYGREKDTLANTQWEREQERLEGQAQAQADYRDQTLGLQRDQFGYQKQQDNLDRIAAAWREVTLPDGQVMQVNSITGDQRVIDPRTRVDRAVVEQKESEFVQEQARGQTQQPIIQEAETLLGLMNTPGQDVNVGGWYEGFQRLTSPLNPFNTETQGNTDRLNQFLNNFTLDNASKLAGALSDKDIDLLHQSKPHMGSDEKTIKDWLYRVVATDKARRQIAQEKRALVDKHGPSILASYDDDSRLAQLMRDANDAQGTWEDQYKASTRAGAGNNYQRDEVDALRRANSLIAQPQVGP